MAKDLNDYIRSLPKKETVEFAKNLTFAVTLQAVSMSLLAPHHGQPAGIEYGILSTLMALITAFVTIFSAVVFMDAFKTPVTTGRYYLFIALCIVAMFAAGQVTKDKLLELTSGQNEKAPQVAGLVVFGSGSIAHIAS